MAKLSLTVALVFLTVFTGIAQRLNHPLRAAGGESSVQRIGAHRSFPDTLKILAIMVQFLPDSDPLTSGNGQFDVSTQPQRIIDAPPRDSAYFADHFRFARNYFQKASNGRQNISTTVLGKVLTLPKLMKQYAPSNSNLPLGQLVEDAWKMTDSLYTSFPFQDYNLFVIFHAGSGKDIDLRGSLGYDPTPYDLPSLYFSFSGLKNIFGQSYAGVQLNNHPAFTIKNSVILPETENRLLPGLTGDFLYQLGINGLIVANIGSHLGLPDLFDTKTGGTAIGRFGLMDGQSIFSYSGLFPPEPCAWEKIYLGWTSPILVGPGTSILRVPAAGKYQTSQDTVYKIPLSAKEYFLVENRYRDVKADGETLTIRWNGQEFPKFYLQDDPHFNSSTVDSIYGTVVDVDELDWSLPGFKEYLGGILIWHIDESVIEKNISTNSINADPGHRGVDLEEADGSQDIGQSYGLLDPGSGSEEGSPLDFWFAKNISPVFKNEFGETTNPNSLSYSLARSHVTLNHFSDAAPVMTLQSTIGDASITLLKTIKRKNVKLNNNDSPLFADIDGTGSQKLIYTSGDSVYVLKNDMTPFLNNLTGLFSTYGGKFQPAILKKAGSAADSIYIVVVRDSTIIVLTAKDLDNNGLADTLRTIHLSANISTPPATVIDNDPSLGSKIIVGDEKGNVNVVSLSSSNAISVAQTRISSSAINSVASNGLEAWTGAAKDSIRNSSASSVGFSGKNIIAFSHTQLPVSGISFGVALFDDNTFAVFDDGTFTNQALFRVNGMVTGSLALADVNYDGQPDILIGADNGLYGYNRNGVLLENFPLKVPDGGKVIGDPVVAKLFGNNLPGIIFGSSNGLVCGYDGNGKIINGFPLQTGGVVSSPVFAGDLLSVASTDSSVYLWRLNNLLDSSKVFWNGFLADIFHSNVETIIAQPVAKSFELLPSAFAYNWPNPVYGASTNIRYYLSTPATVGVKIFNMAGELVDEFSGPGLGRLDNEIQWNVSKVQSGVYFAQIKASASGEEKSVVIKIAVVK